MERVQANTKLACVLLVSICSYLLGGWDKWLEALFMFTATDYITGVLVACKEKALSSDVAFWGGIKKIMIYVVVALAVQLDGLIPMDSIVMRTSAIGYYIGAEGISIAENLYKLNVIVPKKLVMALVQLRDKFGGCKDDNN